MDRMKTKGGLFRGRLRVRRNPGLILLPGHEPQRRGVDAVAHPGRRRAVVKHVAQVGAIRRAMHLVADHAEGGVGLDSHK